MSKKVQNNKTDNSKNKVIHYSLQLLALGFILYSCYNIINPFLNIFIWGGVLSITLYPLYIRLTNIFKGKKIVPSIVITLTMLLIIIVPAGGLLFATVDEFSELKDTFHDGKLTIPPPQENIKEWPIFGDKVFTAWTEASEDINVFVDKHRDQIQPVLIQLLGLLSSAGKGILMLLGSIIVSGVFLIYANSAGNFSKSLLTKLSEEHGESITTAVAITVRNVAKGILGVAFIQCILVGIGLVIAGVPFAGIWTLICLLLAIVQIGIFPVSIGVIIYIWGVGDTTTAVLLTIWMVFLGLIDNFLKPIMMGKGAPAPMLVVFMGTIGGFIANGFIGLFTGAIIFSVSYNLIVSWVNNKPIITEEDITPSEWISKENNAL
jgi:predicted PurR-regulated permease PerM